MACKHENWHYGMNSVKYCLACDQPIIGTLGDTSLSLLVIARFNRFYERKGKSVIDIK